MKIAHVLLYDVVFSGLPTYEKELRLELLSRGHTVDRFCACGKVPPEMTKGLPDKAEYDLIYMLWAGEARAYSKRHDAILSWARGCHEKLVIGLHAPQEMKNPLVKDLLQSKEGFLWGANRPTTKALLKGHASILMPLPYSAKYTDPRPTAKAAITTTRCTVSKHHDYILQAFRDHGTVVEVYSNLVNFFYDRNLGKIVEGGMKKHLHYHPGIDSRDVVAFKALMDGFSISVALTDYSPYDGGSFEYCMLEGIDAGHWLIVNSKWTGFPGMVRDGVNCIAVSDSDELADAIASLNKGWEPYDRQKARAEAITGHSPGECAEALLSSCGLPRTKVLKGFLF